MKSDNKGEISYDIPYILNLERNYTNEPNYKTEIDSQAFRMSLCLPQEKVKGRDSSGVWDGHVYTAKSKMDNQQDLLYIMKNSAPCYVEAWMGGELGGEWIHVYVWLSSFDIYLKPLQHCLLTGPGLGRYPGEGNGNPLQYSCLEKPTDRGAWQLQSMELQSVGHD